MNIQQIEYIIAVTESENFVEAAEKCNVTQSTLSTMISRFEGETGIRVFDRSSKPVSLTREGSELLEKMMEISKNFDDLKETIRNLKGEVGGTLSIGVIPTVAPYLLPLFLKEFTSAYPELFVTVSEMTTPVIMEQLIQRKLDVGIVSTGINDSKLIEYPIYDEPFVLYDFYSKKSQKKINADDINYDRLWLMEEGHCLRTQVERICQSGSTVVQKRNFDFQAGSIDSLMRFVKRNEGLTLLPYLSVLDMKEEDQNRISSFEKPIPGRSIGLIINKHFVKKGILNLLAESIERNIKPLLTRKSVDLAIQPM